MTEFEEYIISKIIEELKIDYTVEEFSEYAGFRLSTHLMRGLTDLFEKEDDGTMKKKPYDSLKYEKSVRILMAYENYDLDKYIPLSKIEEWVEDYNNTHKSA